MRGFKRTLATAFLTAGVTFAGGAAHAAKFKVLVSFAHKLGSNPMAPVLIDQTGNLYTTASQLGPRGGGTVVELSPKPGGGYKTKAIFRFDGQGARGGQPNGPLIIDTQGNLYGTADNLVFELSPVTGQKAWGEKILHQFCSQQNCTDGNGPTGGLTYAGASSGAPYDGSSPLFGATGGGGDKNGGTVFKLTNSSGNWAEKVLYNFCSEGGSDCTDGYVPTGGVVLDVTGNLYGATVQGGGNKFQTGGAGVIFEFSPGEGTETVLYRFCSGANCADGARPVGNLAMDAAGSIYGATVGGGACDTGGQFGCGVIFKVLPNGSSSQESVLYTFCQQRDCRDGLSPQAGLFLDSTGNLFGTTYQGGGNDIDYFGVGGGVVFQLKGAALKVLHRFCSFPNCGDGEYPAAPLVTGGATGLYGTTTLGGRFGDATDGGTAFKILLGQSSLLCTSGDKRASCGGQR
jgi:uncharacterized repeat protein (TIGR03803 family)